MHPPLPSHLTPISLSLSPSLPPTNPPSLHSPSLPIPNSQYRFVVATRLLQSMQSCCFVLSCGVVCKCVLVCGVLPDRGPGGVVWRLQRRGCSRRSHYLPERHLRRAAAQDTRAGHSRPSIHGAGWHRSATVPSVVCIVIGSGGRSVVVFFVRALVHCASCLACIPRRANYAVLAMPC